MRRMISDNQLNSLKAPDVIITGVPESAVQGTLTQEQIERLLANDKSRIIFNNEYYYLNDKFHKNGALTYTHSGYDETGIDKYLNITVTTREWVLTETNISGGGSEDFKLIKLNGGITTTELTQEQIDIIFPKDEQGNIYRPEYNICVRSIDDQNHINYFYLKDWSKNNAIFGTITDYGYNNNYSIYYYSNSFGVISSYKVFRELAQHTLYVKTLDMYFYTTVVYASTYPLDIQSNLATLCYDKHLQASGWLTSANAPITGFTYNSNENKFYVSTNSGKDYAFFTYSDIMSESFDDVTEI